MKFKTLEDTAEFSLEKKEELDFDLEMPNNDKAKREIKLSRQETAAKMLRAFFSPDKQR